VKRLGPIIVTALVVAASAQGAAATNSIQGKLYSLGATTRCLEARGAVVEAIRPRDSRLRALRDLAQRTSQEARIGSKVVGLAFLPTAERAQLLVELLTVPRDPYRVERRTNVVLLARPRDRGAAAIVVGCLRGGSGAESRST
jgi:hypothetical protein